MNILVCLKQVLDDSVSIGYNEATGKFTPDNVDNVENAFDTYALEMATRLKETVGDANITLLSIGTDEAKVALKNGLAVGGDEASVIIANNYENSTPYDIANAITEGIKKIEEKIGKLDIIFTGKEATDTTSGQVGVIISEILDTGVITDLVDISVAEGKVVGKHETEVGYELIEAAMPCVVTVSKPAYDPRYATIKSKMAARKKTIDEISDVIVNDGTIVIKKTYERPKRQAGIKIAAKPAEEQVAELMAKLSDAKVL